VFTLFLNFNYKNLKNLVYDNKISILGIYVKKETRFISLDDSSCHWINHCNGLCVTYFEIYDSKSLYTKNDFERRWFVGLGYIFSYIQQN